MPTISPLRGSDEGRVWCPACEVAWSILVGLTCWHCGQPAGGGWHQAHLNTMHHQRTGPRTTTGGV